MEISLVITRIIHIVSGAFWVGSAIYLALILEPAVRTTSAEVERHLLSKTSKLNSRWITGAAVITILTGFSLVSATPGRSFSDLGSGGWGMMILIGLVAAVAAFFVSGWAGAFTAKLRRGLDSEDATETELAGYRRGLATLGYINAALVVIAVSAMASARYV